MEKKESKINQLHPAFYRSMSDVSYSLSIAINFCSDEFTRNELIGIHDAIAKIYMDLLDKSNENGNTK